MIHRNKIGFTLIELLVVITIIAVLSGVSLFALQGSRSSARDAKRKADMETLRSALEIYRSDCNKYPATVSFDESQIKGDNSNTSCLSSNVYLEKTPEEVLDDRDYYYSRISNTSYILCAALETDTTIDTDCGAVTDFNCTLNCTYGVTQP